MNSDGSAQVNLTKNSATDARPSWAHNGQIAFMSNRDGNMEIYVDGSQIATVNAYGPKRFQVL